MPSRSRRTASASLGSAGAELIRTAHLASGVTISEWRSRAALLEYQALPKHLLSVNLSGGRRCRHLCEGRPASRGFDGAVCLFPAGGSVSHWALAESLRLLHVDFDQSSLLTSLGRSPGSPAQEYRFREVFQEHCPIISCAAQSIAHADWTDAALSSGIDALSSWMLRNVVRIYAGATGMVDDPRGRFPPAQAQLVVAYLQANLADTIPLDELAQHFHLSRYHFLRKFRRTFGAPPHAYLTALRMERAHRLLTGGAVKVSAVAHACGYAQPSRFASAFQRHFGYAPVDLKRAK